MLDLRARRRSNGSKHWTGEQCPMPFSLPGLLGGHSPRAVHDHVEGWSERSPPPPSAYSLNLFTPLRPSTSPQSSFSPSGEFRLSPETLATFSTLSGDVLDTNTIGGIPEVAGHRNYPPWRLAFEHPAWHPGKSLHLARSVGVNREVGITSTNDVRSRWPGRA